MRSFTGLDNEQLACTHPTFVDVCFWGYLALIFSDMPCMKRV